MKYIYQLSLVLSLCILIGCNKDNPALEFKNTKVIEIGDYSLDFPEQFELVEIQGVDSYVGTINGSGLEIKFDFGFYSVPYEDLDASIYDVTMQTFESVERQIVAAKDPSIHFTAMYITNIDDPSPIGSPISLHMKIDNITTNEQDVILEIFGTARLTD